MNRDNLPSPDYVHYMIAARRARSQLIGALLTRGILALGGMPQRAWAFAMRRGQNERGKPSTCSAT